MHKKNVSNYCFSCRTGIWHDQINTPVMNIVQDLILQRECLPVMATRRGKQRRLARTISSMGSRPGQGVRRPQYRNSSTPRIQAVLVLGMDTWKMTRSREKRKKNNEWKIRACIKKFTRGKLHENISVSSGCSPKKPAMRAELRVFGGKGQRTHCSGHIFLFISGESTVWGLVM